MNFKEFKSLYYAFVLSETSRFELLAKFPPAFSRVTCHHVTMAFNIDDKAIEFSKLIEKNPPTCYLINHMIGAGVECFAVNFLGLHEKSRRLDGGSYHLTHSVEPPRKPVDSNKLFQTSDIKINNFKDVVKLTGEFKFIKK